MSSQLFEKGVFSKHDLQVEREVLSDDVIMIGLPCRDSPGL